MPAVDARCAGSWRYGDPAVRLSLERAPTGAPALSFTTSPAGGELAASGFSRNAPERDRGESMPKRGKTGPFSTVSVPFLRPPFRVGKLRFRLAVTCSRVEGWPLLAGGGKRESSRNGHTVPDRRACLSGD